MKNNLISKWRTILPLSSLLAKAKRKAGFSGPIAFENSRQYWEDRYRSGGSSGAGSYGRLARFKADFLNNFVEANNIHSIVEFGCGDGAQLALAEYPGYVGFDVSPLAVEICRKKFRKEGRYRFYHTDISLEEEGSFDLAVSLDVVYHLVEDDLFHNYMYRLFQSSRMWVIIYAYNFEKLSGPRHEPGREFLSWCKNNAGAWDLEQTVKNAYPYDPKNKGKTSRADFYVFKKRADCVDI